MATTKLPVVRVLLMEDRAQVTHEAEVTLAPGAQAVSLEGLSPLLVDRSLKVEVRGSAFVDARVERHFKEKPKGGLPADASALRRRVDELHRELKLGADEIARLALRAELLAATRADLLRAIAEHAGAGKAETGRWHDELDTISARQGENDAALYEARQTQTRTDQHTAEAELALAQAEEREQDVECGLVVTVEAASASRATVVVEYLVPCAVWRPSYRATLLGDRVRVEAEAVIWQRTGQDWRDVAVRLSTMRPTLGTAPPHLVEDRLHTRDKTSREKQVVGVAVREQAIASAGEGGAAVELPGLDDGGEPRLLEAPARATLPSDGEPHHVPLFTFEAKVATELVCPAEVTSQAFVVGRFSNTSGQVLLAGPVELVRQSGYVGRTRLKFAAPGETVKLSFGAEDGLRILRTVEEKTDESRLTGRRTVSKTVTLHVSNLRPHPANLVVEERVPISEVKEVEVQLTEKRCDPRPPPPSPDGIVRLPLELPAQGTRKAVFAWELSAAAKVAGI